MTESPTSVERAPTGHPKGLYLLFATEMWERTSFYGMRALLVLYMTSKSGFGWTDAQALGVYGWYSGLVYLTPIIGGYLADRYIGQRRAVLLGGTLMMVGHFLMAVPGHSTFYAALGFIIAGNGLFKPNISTMVGGLYAPKDPRRDGAFSIFYMGINVGATMGALGCGTLGEKVGWDYGFAAAGVGMLLGVIVFAALNKQLLGDVGLSPTRDVAAQAMAAQEAKRPLTREEWDRIITLFLIIVFASMFWAAFEQAGGLMNIYAARKVNRSFFGWETPASWFQAANSGFIILLSPVAARLWVSLGERNKDPSPILKMAAGLGFAGLGFAVMVLAAYQNQQGHLANSLLLLTTYVMLTAGELCLSPVGLSLTTKLAPTHLVSRLMGVWFLSNFFGNKLAGFIGSLASDYGDLAIFAGLAVSTVVAGLLLLVLSRMMIRMMHGADETKPLDQLAQPPPRTASAAG